jgi:hypothetical protein
MRLRLWQVMGLALAFAGAFAPVAAAQRRRGLVDVSPPHERRGLWLNGGIGAGEESFKFGGDPWSRGLTKPTFTFGIGGTVNPRLRLGFEGTGWFNRYQDDQANNVTESLWSLLAVARFFPSRNAGLFLKGGGGLGVSAVSVEAGTGTSETGFATMLGAGYEIRLSPKLYLTPGVEWYRHSFQKRGDATLYERLVNVNLALTWQPGR